MAMPASSTVQIVAFQGCPQSLGRVARQVLQKGSVPQFLCVLEPGESSDTIRRAWEFSVQPLSQAIHLMIIHERRERAFERIAEFASALVEGQPLDVDLLFVSDESSWRGSRLLARRLGELQDVLAKAVPNSLVRRI
jgi:hypothetical protein